MKLATDDYDAIELIQKIHHQIFDLQETLSKLEYLVYEKDERCEIEFFGRGRDDKRGSQKRTKAD